MKNKILLLLAILTVTTLSTSQEVKAQDYHAGVGISLGSPIGFEYKQFFSSKSAISASLGYAYGSGGALLNATYQYHIPVYEKLNFYAGGGVSLGPVAGEFVFGITPNIGIEYKIPTAPLAIALDYKPLIAFSSSSMFSQSGLKILYTF